MRVPVLTDIKKIEIQDKPRPEIDAGEALVKVAYCGVCGSDVHGYLNGDMIPVGAVMGHECSGTVSAVGNAVTNVQPGDRVAVRPMPQCGECYWCQRGQYSICPGAIESGLGINDQDVVFNNFQMVVREIEMKGVLGCYDEFQDVIAHLGQGEIKVEQLISDIISLDDLEELGIKHLLAVKDLVKILVKP